MNMISDIYS
uniref:Uncharacterized protein n=1 Tax=Oryza meridionalis TaxID=40149 RepID=A0A0G2KBP0_9ORYZ